MSLESGGRAGAPGWEQGAGASQGPVLSCWSCCSGLSEAKATLMDRLALPSLASEVQTPLKGGESQGGLVLAQL